MNKIFIHVQGHEHTKKSYLISFLKRHLDSVGIKTNIQEFHLDGKLDLTDEELKEKLQNLEVFIFEQNT